MANRAVSVNEAYLFPPPLEGRLARAMGNADAPNGIDDTASLNAQLLAAQGKTLKLLAGQTYKISATVNVPSRTTLDFNGAILDARAMPAGVTLGERVAIKSAGARVATLSVSTALAKGSRIISGISSTDSMSPGDIILLRNDEPPVPGMTRVDRDKGEMLTVKTVDSTTQITVTTGLLFDYGITGLLINTLDMVRDVKIIDPKIIMGGIGSNHNGIEIQYGVGINITGAYVDGAEGIGINLRTVIDSEINSPHVKNSTSGTAGTTGYGVAINDGSRRVNVNEPIFENCRHFVAGGGVWPTVFVNINNAYGSVSISTPYDTHEPCFYWNFNNCTAENAIGGFIMRGQHITITGGNVINSSHWGYQAMVFDGVTEQRGIRFVDCKVDGAVLGGYQIDGIADNSRKIDCAVVNSVARNPGTYGVSAANFDRLDVDVKVVGSTNHSVLIQGVSNVNRSTSLTLKADVANSLINSLFLRHIDGIVTAPSNLTNSGGTGIQVTECDSVGFELLRIAGTALGGVTLSNCTKVVFNSPIIGGGVSASYDAIRATGSTDVSVIGGILSSARNAIYTSTTDYVTVMGVNVRGAASASKIGVDATNKVVVNNLV